MKIRIIILTGLVLGIFFGLKRLSVSKNNNVSGAPPNGESEINAPALSPLEYLKRTWTRPEGRPKVGLQVGHLNNQDFPEELKKLRKNGGSSGGGFTEAEVNLAIAEKTAEILENEGIRVDILPATVPPEYWADVFIAIHADGSTSPDKSGFKIAGPWRDLTGKSNSLAETLEKTYQAATNFEKDPNITRNMRGYYAFSWWRYNHAIHPMTTAVIVETGFLTNWSDRQLIAVQPEIPARALAEGVVEFLEEEKLLT